MVNFSILLHSAATLTALSSLPLVSALSDVFQLGFKVDTDILHLHPRDQDPVEAKHSSDFPFSFNFTIGTPPQKFSGLLSNMYGDILVNYYKSDVCESSTTKSYCSEYGSYDSNSSSTFNDTKVPFSLPLASNLTGVYVQETLEFAGIELPQFPIAVLTESTFSQARFGIGYPHSQAFFSTYNRAYENLPFILKLDGYTKSASYSIWSDSRDDFDGSILFGGIDRAKFTGNLTTVPVQPYKSNYTYPDIKVTSVMDPDGKSVSGEVLTSISIGRTISAFPQGILLAITNQFPGFTYDEDLGVYTGNCVDIDDDDSFTLNLGSGKSLELYLKDLQIKSQSSDSCYLLASKAEVTSEMYLGLSIFSSYFFYFNLESHVIGFAPASFSSDSDIQVVSGNSTELGSGSSSGTSSSSRVSSTYTRTSSSLSSGTRTISSSTSVEVTSTSSFNWVAETTRSSSTNSVSTGNSGNTNRLTQSPLIFSFLTFLTFFI